jgi:hypothetical protein
MPPTKKQVVRQMRQHEVNYKRMAKEKAETEKRAATNIQRMWRGRMRWRQHEVNYKRMAKEKAETEKRAATNIQRMWRGCIWRTAVQAVLMRWRIRRGVSSCVEAVLMRWRISEVA